MKTRRTSNVLGWTVMALLVTGLAASGAALAQAHSHGGSAPAAHQHLDAHLGHNQYYFDHGHAVRGNHAESDASQQIRPYETRGHAPMNRGQVDSVPRHRRDDHRRTVT